MTRPLADSRCQALNMTTTASASGPMAGKQSATTCVPQGFRVEMRRGPVPQVWYERTVLPGAPEHGADYLSLLLLSQPTSSAPGQAGRQLIAWRGHSMSLL